MPIFKQGDKMITSNYTPISILSYFEKIMEKAMYNRLSSYVNRMSLLYPRQYGFRPGHSTDMALLNIHDLITEAIDTSKFSIGIFLDLANAFDTVDQGSSISGPRAKSGPRMPNNWPAVQCQNAEEIY